MALLLELQENAGRAQDVARVDEGRSHTSGHLHDLSVDRGPPEKLQAVQCVEGRVERFDFIVPALARTVACIFLLHVRRI
jgi:hypothetical protein